MSEFVEDLRGRIVGGLTVKLGVSPETAAMVAAEIVGQISRDWRGDRPYIGPTAEARAEISRRNAAIRRDRERGESARLIARRYQISVKRVWAICAVSAPA